MGTSVCTDHHLLLLRDLHIPATASVYDTESDPYLSDEFRMYEFKIRRCTRRRSHDWKECPFAHQGDKARRGDPGRHPYSASVCPDFRCSGGSSCPRGDACGFAHGVFEAWLHPSCYRIKPCKDGPHCPRKVCFFAHTLTQLCELVGSLRAASFKDSGGSRPGGSWAGVYGGQYPIIVSPLTPGSINLRGSVDNYSFDVSPPSRFKEVEIREIPPNVDICTLKLINCSFN